MGVVLRKCLLVFVIIGPAAFLPGASGVEPRDYEEALKEDEPVETVRASESSTEYPNGVNVIPGNADIHYPTYDKIPKSSFSCLGRIPGFYADAELRCQVWHICDETQVQQSFLCTNGTIYSQDKRVCDWWYNVNCDPEEVSKNYEQNKELYKGPPPKDGSTYEEATSNDLPPPPPPSHKKQPVQQQLEQRPQHPKQPQQQRPQSQQQSQRPQQAQQRPQQQNYNQPQASSQQQQRAEALKVLENYERQQQTSQNQNYEKPQQTQQEQQQREQQRAEALKVIQNYEQSQQRSNHEAPQGRRQPQQSQQNYIAPTQPAPRPTQASATPEKKRVIVLRLPGPLPPGATIPPHILMEYAESVLAAERSGKAPPAGLVSNKQVSISNNGQPTRPQQPSQQQQQQQRPQQEQQQYQQRPQQEQQHHHQRPHPQTTPQPQHQEQPSPQQQVGSPPKKQTPRGPILPYTPRPFSAFLEDAVRHNGQSKSSAFAPPQQQQQTHRHQQTQQPSTPIPSQPPQQQQQQPLQQRRYEEPRPSSTPTQRPQPQQNYEQQQPQQRRSQQQQRQPPVQEQSYQEEDQSSPQQSAPVPPQNKKVPTVQYKPSKASHSQPPTDSKKFRHSTPRKHGEIKFAPKSSVSLDDLSLDDERQVHEESRRPAYFNNFQHVPHLSQDVSTAQTYQTQPPPPKADVHLKSSFEFEKVRSERVFEKKQHHETPTVVPERYLTPDEIHEPAIKRLVVAAGLKIKDPRNKQLTTPVPSSGSSEESYHRERNYEPVRVIVARKSTTTPAPEINYQSPSTSVPITRPQQPTKQRQEKSRLQQTPHQEELPTTPQQVVSSKPTPRGPVLPYTPRPFSAFLEDASRHNGFAKTRSTASPQPPQEQIPVEQAFEETTPRVVMRRVIRKKIRTNQHKNIANAAVLSEQPEIIHHQPQVVHHIPRSTTLLPTTTTRPTTKLSTTSTTPYYQPDDDENYEPTKATRNFGFDVYGRTEDDDEEEELVRAAQEYYQFSEDYGKRHRG